MQKYYRAYAHCRSVSDFDLYYVDAHYKGVEVHFETYPVIRRTPCGVWLSMTDPPIPIGSGRQWLPGVTVKFVLNEGRKKWAYPTREEALDSLIIRKRKYLAILQDRVETTEVIVNSLKDRDEWLKLSQGGKLDIGQHNY